MSLSSYIFETYVLDGELELFELIQTLENSLTSIQRCDALAADLEIEYHNHLGWEIQAITKERNFNKVELEAAFDNHLGNSIEIIKVSLEFAQENEPADMSHREFSLMQELGLTEVEFRAIGKLISIENRLQKIKEYISKIANKFNYNTEDFELVDSKTNERVLALIKLGIIDSIQSKANAGISVNAIAKVIGYILNAPQSSIQPLINPIISTSVDQKKNPERNDKLNLKVIATLNQFGLDKISK